MGIDIEWGFPVRGEVLSESFFCVKPINLIDIDSRLTDCYCGWSAFNVGGIAFPISIRAFLDSDIVNCCMVN